jgi:hypothetical protein
MRPVSKGIRAKLTLVERGDLINRRLLLALALLVTVAAAGAASAFAGSGGSASTLPTRDTAGDTAQFTSQGGLTPLADANTIPHWSSQFTDPTNGVTYPYTMVGSNPFTGSGSSTVPTDIIPVRVVFDANGGYAIDGTNRVAAVQASPLFQSNDYSTVTASSGGAGALSPGNIGQLEDVTMRSQFNKVGSTYHLNLGQPTVEATQTIQVPKGKGSAFQTGRGIIYGLVDVSWFSSQVMQILGSTHANPTHLPILLTDNVMLTSGGSCCIIGYHGAALPVGVGAGSTNGNGKQQVQTFAFSAYSTPGLFSAPYIADIHALSHEIAEWGDDPFVNNWVNPWLTPTAPQYGCTGILETGDPVVGIGFKIGTNSFDTNTWSDGTWHPEDEVFLPWFARQSPNTTSEATQAPSANIGRYTLMGDLNPFAGFRQPATGCN